MRRGRDGLGAGVCKEAARPRLQHARLRQRSEGGEQLRGGGGGVRGGAVGSQGQGMAEAPPGGAGRG